MILLQFRILVIIMKQQEKSNARTLEIFVNKMEKMP